LRAQREDTALDSEQELPQDLVHISILMSGLLKTLSESPEEIRKIIDYPLISEILSARTPIELADLVAVAHQRLLRADSVIAMISDRVLTDCLIYLPLADAVVAAIPKKTEEAAFAVMDKFMVVRETAGRAASSARSMRKDLEDTSGEKSIARTAENTRKTVVEERSAIKELSRCTKENRDHLAAMSREIEGGIDLLKNITDITERSKLIAFNMSIEAARIGEKGAGFKVIITELHKLNDRTFEFSRKVSDLLSRFRDYNALLVSNMEEKACAVIGKVEKGMDAAETSVESLITAADHAESLTKDIALMSESIDRDLDGVLESLQFQDITRQMIEGAQGIIGELRKGIDEYIKSSGIALDRMSLIERFSILRNRLISDAKTKGEKNALMEVKL